MNTFKLFSSLIIVIALTGCASKTTTSQVLPTSTPSRVANTQSSTAAAQIAAAMAKGSPVSCTIAKADGSNSMSFLVKGKKTKVSGAQLSGSKGTGYMLNDSQYLYIWNDADKKGTKMDLAKINSMASASAITREYQDFSREDVEQMYKDQGYTYTCEEKAVSDSEFVVPTDVVFSDMSQLLEQTKKLQDTSGKAPSAEDITKYQEMLKQYQQ